MAVVTLGAQGAMAVDSETGEEEWVPSLPVSAYDPTGAGDCFGAGFCGAGRQSLACKIAIARPAIEHHIARMNHMHIREINAELHFRQVEWKHITIALGNPEWSFGRLP